MLYMSIKKHYNFCWEDIIKPYYQLLTQKIKFHKIESSRVISCEQNKHTAYYNIRVVANDVNAVPLSIY